MFAPTRSSLAVLAALAAAALAAACSTATTEVARTSQQPPGDQAPEDPPPEDPPPEDPPVDPMPDPSTAMTGTVRIIYLHHSTGGVIWDGGVQPAVNAWNTAHGTDYRIGESSYPDSPYPWENYPYDYWNLWVAHTGSSRAQSQANLDDLAAQYDVIVFKHCYPVSDIEPDGAPSISSRTKTLANYRLQYAALKTRLRQFTDKRFVVWTGAAEAPGATGTDQADRAIEFATWVKTVWDEPGDNIFVWDFRQLETGGGRFLLPEYTYNGDSHPNATFGAFAAPLVARRIVDVIEGRGDTGSLTGQ